MKMKHVFWILIILFSSESLFAKKIRPSKILKMIRQSDVLNAHFTGFALYDLDNRQMIAGLNSDKHFTPASNAKLFTFYAGLKLLKDSIAGMNYKEQGDSLIIWGTGDPSFLNTDFGSQPVLTKLNNSGKKIYWASGRFTGDFYGVGWTYDDYNEYYQPEMSELPVYGNIVQFSNKNEGLLARPSIDYPGFRLSTDSIPASGRFRIRRDIMTNEFFKPNGDIPSRFSQVVPFKVNSKLVSDLLERNITGYAGSISMKVPSDVKTWNSISSDTLYKRMLLPSDNFIAEQILLNIAATRGMEMKTSAVIDYILKNHLSDLPDKVLWVDGSGLSRQNLFTPRSMIKLCEKIYDEVGNENRLFDLLPQGGKSGTLRNQYKSEKPFVFAKTGSLSNNHNLTGYLITGKGRKLIFSFMNNNFTVPAVDVRAQMEKVITRIHRDY